MFHVEHFHLSDSPEPRATPGPKGLILIAKCSTWNILSSRPSRLVGLEMGVGDRQQRRLALTMAHCLATP